MNDMISRQAAIDFIKDSKMELRTCNRKNLCVDCDNAECALRKQK